MIKEGKKITNLKRIAVFTSGGDAPGMNAAIRGTVRAALYYGLEVYGVKRGYDGLINGKIKPMNSRSVSNIIHRGGTILKSARSSEFRTKEGRKKAYNNIKKLGIDALVAIGGDGTFTGASLFYEEYGIPTMGIPGTIDNDLAGTDFTIGYDTATNTAVEAIDKIRDTASSHNRLFFIEVMGRDSGFIAVRSAIAAGAEAIIVPEKYTGVDDLIERLEFGQKNKKTSSLVVVAEGSVEGGAFELAQQVKKRFDYETKVTILGHIQRGGTPTVADRVLAGRMGVAAVQGLLAGKIDSMVGIIHNQITYTPIAEALKMDREINESVWETAKILAT
ncbi:MAG: 6-phosphofructokinase [Saprospiraceae bacterium]